MPCIPKNTFTTHQARCLVSVSERHSLFSFSLLSLTVESVIHGLSDRRYLLLFELKHNNKQQMNLQLWFWSVEQLISRPWLLLIAIAISCLTSVPGSTFSPQYFVEHFCFSIFRFQSQMSTKCLVGCRRLQLSHLSPVSTHSMREYWDENFKKME